jgi:hypothetical protein
LELNERIIWVVRMSVVPEKESDFDKWYDQEHLPGQFENPYVTSATRLKSVQVPDGFPTDDLNNVAVYELRDAKGFFASKELKESVREREKWDPFVRGRCVHLLRVIKEMRKE